MDEFEESWIYACKMTVLLGATKRSFLFFLKERFFELTGENLERILGIREFVSFLNTVDDLDYSDCFLKAFVPCLRKYKAKCHRKSK